MLEIFVITVLNRYERIFVSMNDHDLCICGGKSVESRFDRKITEFDPLIYPKYGNKNIYQRTNGIFTASFEKIRGTARTGAFYYGFYFGMV